MGKGGQMMGCSQIWERTQAIAVTTGSACYAGRSIFMLACDIGGELARGACKAYCSPRVA